MEKLIANQTEAIDVKKRLLEAKAQVRFRKLFNNIAEDVSNLLLTTQNINSNDIAKNYRPDFVGALRETYREVIKVFGFSLRQEAEKKFKVNFEIKNKPIEYKLETTPTQEREVNKDFSMEAVLFINNRSEIQADIITDTNGRQIQDNIDKSVSEYNVLLADNMAKQDKLNEQLTNIGIAILLGAATEKDRINIGKELEKLKTQNQLLIDNRNPIISRGFKNNFTDASKNRSEIISEYEVGQTESFIRQKEAESIDKVVLSATIINIKKNWASVGDSKVRDDHVIADKTYRFNPIPVDEYFFVGGEKLKAPRLGSIPSNNIRCRCNSLYIFQ